MMTNFHTHTMRCRHAWGSDEDYVKEAIKDGYQILGFADHACWPYVTQYHPNPLYTYSKTVMPDMQQYVRWIFDEKASAARMSPTELPDYVRSIRHLKAKYHKWIDIRLGMEAEYDPHYMDWMLDRCIEHDLDYLILGQHYVGGEELGKYTGGLNAEDLQAYVDSIEEALETGMYAYLAHPDFIMRSYTLSMDEKVEDTFRQIARISARLNIPVEYNCAGMMANICTGIERYPHHRFWEIASEEGCKAIIGMDAHCPEYLDPKYHKMARDYLESLGMEIVEDIGKTDFKAIKARKLAKCEGELLSTSTD